MIAHPISGWAVIQEIDFFTVEGCRASERSCARQSWVTGERIQCSRTGTTAAMAGRPGSEEHPLWICLSAQDAATEHHRLGGQSKQWTCLYNTSGDWEV